MQQKQNMPALSESQEQEQQKQTLLQTTSICFPIVLPRESVGVRNILRPFLAVLFLAG